MKTLHFHLSHELGVLIAVLVMTPGCASTGTDLVEQGEAKVEYIPSRYAHIHRVSVYQEEKTLLISGELHGRFHRKDFVPGHVDIEVISPDGDILQKGSTRYHRIGRTKSLKFSIQFPDTIPQGSRIRVVHHPVFLQQEPRIFRHPDF
jgi:hypothetical protein